MNADQVASNREPTREQIKRWRKHLAEERMEARTYRDLSERRTGEERAVLLQLEEAERRHEEYWLARLGERALPAPKPPLRTRAASVLAHLFGTIFILAMAQRAEQRSARDVDDDVPAHMQADEHIHAEVIRSLAAKSRETLAGTFRAAVFGANDGLVSNLALVLGVAATGMEPHVVLLTGISGLLAGALSMGAGEWVSVRSQRELLDASIPDPDAHQAVPDLDVDANEQALALVRLLRHQGVRVGILSNAPYPIAKAIRRSEWGSLFDFFAFSCDYGICKPARGIYRDVLHRLGGPVSEVAFIDDRRENVRAAELLGVQGIVWEGAKQAEARLKELGFLF